MLTKKTVVKAGLIACLFATGSAMAGFFIGGQCTWGVASIKGDWKLVSGSTYDWWLPWSGNAKDWCASASAAGYTVNNTQTVGAIVVFPANPYSSYGHVGIVTSANKMKSMNYSAPWVWTTNTTISTYPTSSAPVAPSCYIQYRLNKI